MKIKKSKSIRELVYEQLKMLVINGEIVPGERIVETEYAEKFNVSRTPLREAIRMLELEGFLELRPKGGVFVKPITREDVEEIYKIRIALEEVILREVINKVDEKGIKKLEKLMEDTEKALNADDDKVFELFSKFNIVLYEIANLKRVEDMITNIKLYLKRIRKMAIENTERKLTAYNDHKNIVLAIKKKDLEKTLMLNREHLERSEFFVKDMI